MTSALSQRPHCRPGYSSDDSEPDPAAEKARQEQERRVEVLRAAAKKAKNVLNRLVKVGGVFWVEKFKG